MTKPRSSLVSLETTPYYHCISRCVRRAFLFGKDDKGRCYDHRKQWIVDRVNLLSQVFAIDIAAYAVMSNHYHLVLHVDKARADAWDTDEIMRRWARLYRGPDLLQRYIQGGNLQDAEHERLLEFVEVWRSELCNISRFMACMNYVVAVHANREDGCTGRFWEGRFKSQALKDETALLACLAYVDLNPIRAGLARNLEKSDYTSIQDRIRTARNKGKPPGRRPRLMRFQARSEEPAIPFKLPDYLDLVDWHGRHVHPGKRGFIPKDTPRLLNVMGLSPRQWKLISQDVGRETSTMLDGLERLDVLERKASVVKVA